HTTVKEWRGFRQHKPGQPWRYQPQNAQPDRLLDRLNEPWRSSGFMLAPMLVGFGWSKLKGRS
ncbi:hypothetical protein, partial [Novacetimonas maltaceti]|uniref:hypothetical protein n=1 Tax=Novacetimonas maltaceti TaxID=1203393 RepID=UPI001ABF86E7